MIDYKAGRWGLGAVYKLRGSIVPKAFVWGVLGALVSAMGKFAMTYTDPFSAYFSGVQDFDAKWVPIWTGFNFVLGFLLVFRATEAYRRYWEAATLLYEARGEFYNCASSLMAFTSSDPDRKPDVKNFQHRMVRLVSMLFAAALQQVSTEGHFDAECLDLEGFDEEPFERLGLTTEKCEVIMQWVQRLAANSMENGVLSAPAPIVSRAFQELSRGIVKVSNARKIRYIMFPFPFAQVSTLLLIFNLVVTPAICALLLETIQWAAVLSFAVVTPLSCVHYIALDLESPFDDSPNSLPLAETVAKMNASLAALLEPWVQETPSYDMPEMSGQIVRAASANFLVAPAVRVSLNLRSSRSDGKASEIQGSGHGDAIDAMQSDGVFYQGVEESSSDSEPEHMTSSKIERTTTQQGGNTKPRRRHSQTAAPDLQMGATMSMVSTAGPDLGVIKTQSLSSAAINRRRRLPQRQEEGFHSLATTMPRRERQADATLIEDTQTDEVFV